MAVEHEEIEHRRIFDKLVATHPATVTLSEWLTFMSLGDRGAAIWNVATCLKTSVRAIKAAELNSYVVVSATILTPGELQINSFEIHLNEAMPA